MTSTTRKYSFFIYPKVIENSFRERIAICAVETQFNEAVEPVRYYRKQTLEKVFDVLCDAERLVVLPLVEITEDIEKIINCMCKMKKPVYFMGENMTLEKK